MQASADVVTVMASEDPLHSFYAQVGDPIKLVYGVDGGVCQMIVVSTVYFPFHSCKMLSKLMPD